MQFTTFITESEIAEQLRRLSAIVREMGSVLVAFSGGIDSTLVLKVAHDVLGGRAAAVTAVSPTLSASELEDCRRIAREIGARHRFLASRVMSRPDFFQNSPQRCYTCKQDLYENAARLADELGFHWLANGTNRDDLSDFRPGLKAAVAYGVRSPLVEAGLDKSDIRRLGRALGLSNWDKPAEACLSSRVPYGNLITMERLDQIERAEAMLKKEGFRQARVRHHGDVARIELSPDEFDRLRDPGLRERLVADFQRIGFRYITLDLQGYRSGSLNPESPP